MADAAVVGSRYEVLESLGEGAMGRVFQARDRVLDETVALKFLRSDLVAAPELARRFRSEIKLARRVSHRNVCRIFDYGEEGERRYISMELVEGEDVGQVLAARRLEPAAAYDIAIQAAEGLQAIHDVGIIHRDLKPANLILDVHGVVKVMDFGLAKQWQSDEAGGITGTGQVVGTPEYMSPEQVRGHKLDFRSDVYALGVVVFELFAGHVPFRGDTVVATLIKHLQDPVPLEGPAASAIPVAVRPVLARALAKDRDGRFPTAAAMAAALREARATAAPAANPDLVPTQLVPGLARVRPAAAAAEGRRDARRLVGVLLGTTLALSAAASRAAPSAPMPIVAARPPYAPIAPVLPASRPTGAVSTPRADRAPDATPKPVATPPIPRAVPPGGPVPQEEGSAARIRALEAFLSAGGTRACATPATPSPAALAPEAPAPSPLPEATAVPPPPPTYVPPPPTYVPLPLARARRVGYGALVELGDADVVPPIPTATPPPPYSPVAARLGLQGTVQLRLLVDERGVVVDAEELSGEPTLSRAAARHVKGRWRYRPATMDGVAVRLWLPVTIRYEIR